jgi:outer membrane protein TolC
MSPSRIIAGVAGLVLCLTQAQAQPVLRPTIPGADEEAGAPPPPMRLRRGRGEFVTVSQAGPAAPALSLRGSVDSALETSPLVKALDATARAADALVLKQKLDFLPTVTGSIGVTRRTLNDGEADLPLRRSDTLWTQRTAGLSLQWPVFNGFQNYFGLQSAISAANAAYLEAEATRGDVAFQTINAYLNFIAAERSVGLIRKNVEMLERLGRAVHARMLAGFASEADVFQVEADIAGLSQQLESMKAERDKARDTVSSMAGRPVQPRASFPALDRLLAQGEEALALKALRHNPRLRAARYNTDAARHSSRAAIGKFLPQVNMVGNYQYDFSERNPLEQDRNSWNLGVQLSVPLVRLSTMAEVRQSHEMATVAALRADEAVRLVALEIRNLWSDYQAGDARLRLARTRVAAQRRVATSWEEQYKLGLISLDNLLTRQRLLTSAEIDEQQAQMQRYALICRLLVSAGIFDPAMLSL